MLCSARNYRLARQSYVSRCAITHPCLCHVARTCTHRGAVPVFSRRQPFSLSSIPSVLVPPVVFGGLLVSLWTYKCMMMVIFQNKIIYMPSVPPFSRSEKVSEYAAQCKPVEWLEHTIESVDGTKIKTLEGSIPSTIDIQPRKHVLVMYFQGNASSLPPRLPYISSVLKSLQQNHATGNIDVSYTLIAVSYRGFWTSKGRPNQAGIELDALAALEWASERYPASQIVLWGQSIGAGVATVSLANLVKQNRARAFDITRRVTGLLLETPFTSLRAMLVAMYPQKFLPYRYLTPFLQSTWDSEAAIQTIAEALSKEQHMKTSLSTPGRRGNPLRIMILQAENDEIVPSENSESLENAMLQCSSQVIQIQRKLVKSALHTEVMVKPEGRKYVVKFLRTVAQEVEQLEK